MLFLCVHVFGFAFLKEIQHGILIYHFIAAVVWRVRDGCYLRPRSLLKRNGN